MLEIKKTVVSFDEQDVMVPVNLNRISMLLILLKGLSSVTSSSIDLN
jgi:hypothetical protein